MNNHDIAIHLQEIASLLEISDASVFRVRAFRRAAEAVEGYPESVVSAAVAQMLTHIEGVGASIAADITSFVERQSSETWDELAQEVPPTLLAVLELRGLGPKKVAAIWRELGVVDVEGLRQAVEQGKVAAMRGFSAKSEEKLKAEIERLGRMQGRTLLWRARAIATSLKRALEALPAVQRVAIAGSTRRWSETVGDLDLLATTSGEPRRIMESFVELEAVGEVLSSGPTKTTVRLRNGMQCDLRVVDDGFWGAALHHFTGSKFHHIELRALAKERGLKISEYGVVDAVTEEFLAGAEEVDVYAALGLPLIPPELREGHGEVSAALAGQLPELVTGKDIRGDLHMHTTASDGTASIEEMARACREKGHEYICISDHSQAVTIANGLTPQRLLAHAEDIRRVDAAIDGIRVFTGCEVDILRDGTLDIPNDVLASLDFVVASIHSGFHMSAQEMTERLLAAIESGVVDAIGHPRGRRLGQREAYEMDFDAVLKAALAHDVALEVNASPVRLDLDGVHCRRAVEMGAKLVVSSDAHSVRGLEVLPFGVAMARRGWVTRASVVNALPLAEFCARYDGSRGARTP